jgi:hypothetical protein
MIRVHPTPGTFNVAGPNIRVGDILRQFDAVDGGDIPAFRRRRSLSQRSRAVGYFDCIAPPRQIMLDIWSVFSIFLRLLRPIPAVNRSYLHFFHLYLSYRR